MRNLQIHAILGAALLFGAVSACGDDSGGSGGAGGAGTTTGTGTTSATTTTTAATTSTDATTTTASTGGSGPGTGGAGGEGGSGGDPFAFADDPYEDYIQIDRHGAVEAGTAGILAPAGLGFNGEDLTIRDEYNASNPLEDTDGDWVPQIALSVEFFHDNLDDDLLGLGLTPATINESLAQAGPVIIPDTIKYDPSLPTAYPNGRTLEDQVVDITLAAVLLDLGVHPLSFFADLPLNPTENDVAFEDDFPFLAPPHPPVE